MKENQQKQKRTSLYITILISCIICLIDEFTSLDLKNFESLLNNNSIDSKNTTKLKNNIESNNLSIDSSIKISNETSIENSMNKITTNLTSNATFVNDTKIEGISEIKKNVSLIKIHEFTYQFREYVYCGKENEIILAITEDNKLMRTKDKGFNWTLVSLPAEQTSVIKKIYE